MYSLFLAADTALLQAFFFVLVWCAISRREIHFTATLHPGGRRRGARVASTGGAQLQILALESTAILEHATRTTE